MRILLVEDNPDVLVALAMVLEREGHEVHVAENGQVALEVLQEIAPPDVVLLDLWMPVMDGWRFLTQLRQVAPPLGRLPVVALSADDRATSGDLPVQRVLAKPVNLSTLLTVIQDVARG